MLYDTSHAILPYDLPTNNIFAQNLRKTAPCLIPNDIEVTANLSPYPKQLFPRQNPNHIHHQLNLSFQIQSLQHRHQP
jgi:hypothetical protein